jgi:signal transduction histidine kinase
MTSSPTVPRTADAAGFGFEISIADNGRGMSAQELALAQGGVKPGKDGAPERRTGLGIPLARQLIAGHDGTREIVSRKGAGTTATIRLP